MSIYSQNEAALDSITLEEVVVSSGIIDVAKERETPIAVSTISAREVQLKVGNMEFPEIMNKTPGVYATKQGGGYGDSRISLRGFDQRNTSFLINGQPVNDMENGWVYWSNWAGLTEVASGIQIQRGLGASKLAVPSVGGTVSIFTKSAEKAKGGSFTQLLGNDGYSKSTMAYNTGLNENGWSTSLLLSKWSGNGYIYNTSGAGTTYFAALGYAPDGSDHKMNLSVLGAGQWHHQRDVWVSIRDYQNFGEKGIDQRWNSNGGTRNGEEWSMRRNFYNKPLATFNWDWEVNDNIEVNTSLYASAGRGGGTGPRGRNYYNSATDILPYRKDLTEHYNENGKGSRDSDGFINFDALVNHNVANTSGYTGDIGGGNYAGKKIGSNSYKYDGVNRAIIIRRASMNSHDWVGAISNFNYRSGKMRYSFGIDLRDYTGYHYRVLNDLMGLDGYHSSGNRNTGGQIIETLVEANPFKNTGIKGPKMAYYNIGNVGWTGLNALAEYSGDDLTWVIQAGTSAQTYGRVDYFAQVGNPESKEKTVSGGYIKGGANYNFNERSNAFFNIGRIARQPNFDAIFPNFANNINPDIQNEEISSIEIGYGYIGESLKVNINAYSTNWGNRFISRGFSNAQGEDGTAQFKDVDVSHKGVEVEADWRPNNISRVRGMLSIGDWRYTKDFDAQLFNDQQQSIGTATLYTKDAKVGDAAQFVAYLGYERRIGSNLNIDLDYRFVDGLYADYSITDSDFTNATNKGALKLPSYGLVDLGATYYMGGNLSMRLNINNLFNTVYIAESNSNIHASSDSQRWNGIDTRNYVWFGFGTTWNMSLRYRF
jgi:outer membrane receptor protein involved in Fe transport|tara:strand:- start:6941 stop:9409 length:2469 start_codon:yes stop_codon:yes gene_type:complete